MDLTPIELEGPCPSCAGSGRVTTISGARVRQLRREAGLSLRALAERLSVSFSYLSDLELGRRALSRERGEQIAQELAKSLGPEALSRLGWASPGGSGPGLVHGKKQRRPQGSPK